MFNPQLTTLTITIPTNFSNIKDRDDWIPPQEITSSQVQILLEILEPIAEKNDQIDRLLTDIFGGY